MNMANYQKFIECIRAMKWRKENPDAGIEIKYRDYADHKEGWFFKNVENLEDWMEGIKIFEIPDDIKTMLLLTDPPKNPDLMRLPFPAIFLEVSISKTEGNLDQETDIVYGILITESPVIEESNGKEIGRVFKILYRNDEGSGMFLDETAFNIDIKSLHFIYKHRPMTAKALQRFIFNLVLFLNQPEVQVIEEVHRTKEQYEKRKWEGKIPLPPSQVVRVTGVLKKYIDALRSGGHFSYSHKFWVRGHWRTLRNPVRYKNKVGTLIWIAPFIKGSGILIDKTYKIQKNPNVQYKKFEGG